jgi:hypothetical protein
VASDPADVGHAGESVIRVDIEDILDGQGGTQKVPSGRVDDTLGLSGRAGGLRAYIHM